MKTVFFACIFQHVGRSETPFAETEFFPDDQPFDAKRPDQYLFNELFRCQTGGKMVEMGNRDLIDTTLRERLYFFTQGSDGSRSGYRFVGLEREILSWMRAECQDSCRQVKAIGRLAQLGEQHHMSPVDTVEISDGEGTGATWDIV